MTVSLARFVLAAIVALAIAQAASGTDKARIAVIGDLDSVSVGISGYCGDKVRIKRKSWQGIYVAGGEPVLIRMTSKVRVPAGEIECKDDYSFVPTAGVAYIVRHSFLGDSCLYELFRVVPGGDPARDVLTHEPTRSCLAE